MDETEKGIKFATILLYLKKQYYILFVLINTHAHTHTHTHTHTQHNTYKTGRPVEVPFDNCIVQYNWLVR